MQNNGTRLLYKGYGIFIQPEIVEFVGGRACAQFLQQIHYWLTSKCKVGVNYKEKKWVYNTIKAWAKILGYSASTIKNCIRRLKEQNIIIIEKLSLNKSNRTNFYTINYQHLNNLLNNQLILKKEKTETPDIDFLPTEETNKSIENEPKNDQSMVKNCPMVIQENTNKNLIQSYKSDESNESENSHKNNFSIEMLNIWNNTIKPDKPTQLNKKRCQFMIAALKKIFNWDIKKWQQYCQLIFSSNFLMGKIKETFQANLDWALKFENIQKIFEGQYGVKFNNLDKNENNLGEIKEENDVLNLIIHEHPEKKIQESFKEISKKIHLVQFKSWFKGIEFKKIENGVAFLKVKNKLTSEFIKRTFTSEILFSFNKFNSEIKEIEIYT